MRYLVGYMIFEAVTSKEVKDFLTDFGWLVSMNFSQIAQLGKDGNATAELKGMMGQIRKPIINGQSYFDFVRDNIDTLPKEPKKLSAVIGIVRDYLVYIEPRIESFVVDGDKKDYFLRKISELKDTYKKIIS